jgi:hypothetical protein
MNEKSNDSWTRDMAWLNENADIVLRCLVQGVVQGDDTPLVLAHAAVIDSGDLASSLASAAVR